jgi:ribulose-phosphate 3-epimerase
MIDDAGLPALLEVDGGIDRRTARAVTGAGADVLVVGSALYKDPEGVTAAVAGLRRAIAEG